jgi:hypothetical protein
VAGDPFRYVSERFGTSLAALHRHKSDHLPAELGRARDAAEVARADDLLGQVRELQGRAMSLLDTAEEAGDLKAAVGAIREARGCLELLARLTQQIGDAPVINLLIMPEWLALRTAILAALEPFPDARLSLASALARTGA